MSNQFIKDQENELREKLPALREFSVNRNIEAPRTDLHGQIAKIYKDMVSNAANQKKTLDTNDYNRQIREIDRQFVEGMTALPPGWANNDEGLKQYNALLETKLKSKTDLTEKYKFKLGTELYEENSLKVRENATQDLYNAANMRNQTILQENNVRKNTSLGNIKSDIYGALATNTLNKQALNRPIHKFDDNDVEMLNTITGENIQAIMNDQNTTEPQKLAELRKVILDREEVSDAYWFRMITDSKNTEFQLRIDNVEQFNPINGLPIMDEGMIQKAVMEGFAAQEHQFKSGAFEEQLVKVHKLSREQAREVSKAAYGTFTESKVKRIKELEIRAAEAEKATLARNQYGREKLYEAAVKGDTAMADNFAQPDNFAGAYYLLKGEPLTPALGFKINPETGKSAFEETIGVKVKDLSDLDMYVADMYTPKHIDEVKSFKTGEEVSEYLKTTILKDVDDPNARELALRSLAHTLKKSGSPLSYDALTELSSKEPDEKMTNIITSLIAYDGDPFKGVPTQQAYNNHKLANTDIVLRNKLGGADGLSMLVRYMKVNQGQFMAMDSTFKTVIGKAAAKGELNQRDFEIALVSAYANKGPLSKEIDGLINTIKKTVPKSVGTPLTASGDQIMQLRKKLSDQKVKSEERTLKQSGLSIKRLTSSTAAGKM